MHIFKEAFQLLNEIAAMFGYTVVVAFIMLNYTGHLHVFGPDVGRMLCIW